MLREADVSLAGIVFLCDLIIHFTLILLVTVTFVGMKKHHLYICVLSTLTHSFFMDCTGDIDIKDSSDITAGFKYFNDFLPKAWGYAIVYKLTTLWLVEYFPGLAYVLIFALQCVLFSHFCKICHLIASYLLENTDDLWQEIKDDIQLTMRFCFSPSTCK